MLTWLIQYAERTGHIKTASRLLLKSTTPYMPVMVANYSCSRIITKVISTKSRQSSVLLDAVTASSIISLNRQGSSEDYH